MPVVILSALNARSHLIPQGGPISNYIFIEKPSLRKFKECVQGDRDSNEQKQDSSHDASDFRVCALNNAAILFSFCYLCQHVTNL